MGNAATSYEFDVERDQPPHVAWGDGISGLVDYFFFREPGVERLRLTIHTSRHLDIHTPGYRPDESTMSDIELVRPLWCPGVRFHCDISR